MCRPLLVRPLGVLLAVLVWLVQPAGTAHASDFDRMLLFKLIPKSLISFYFRAPDLDTIPNDKLGSEIRYGRELITRTAYYLGPKGSVGQYLGNHMSCSNCHMEGGTRLFGGSLTMSHARYPEYMPREDMVISLADRINLCITRPHIGRNLEEDSREMRAMLSYIKWLGNGTSMNGRRFGDEMEDLPILGRAADPQKGRHVFEQHCQVCHGADGQGQRTEDGVAYVYPPLWGPDSYGIGSSMHRVRKAAGFIKNNMPFGTTWENPVLTDEEAYDVAAFINDDSVHPRKMFDVSKDYVDLREKPVDYPYGPYADNYSEMQHKYGPYKPIVDERKKLF
jgi:thiosulfate dehydrogenase